MNETQHVDDWALEQIAEGALPEPELRRASAHLESCGRCAAELEGHRALNAALAGLPRFAPSAAFGEAVMARVRIPGPSPAWAPVRRWIAGTGRGRALLAAALVAPAMPTVWLVAWLLTRPGLSAAAVWEQAVPGAQAIGSDALGRVLQWGLESGAFAWLRTAIGSVQTVPLETMAGLFGVLAIAMPLSAWSLFRLIRTPVANATYAN